MKTNIFSLSTTSYKFLDYIFSKPNLFVHRKEKSNRITTVRNILHRDYQNVLITAGFQLLQTFNWSFLFFQLLMIWFEKLLNSFMFAGDQKCHFYIFRFCCENKGTT